MCGGVRAYVKVSRLTYVAVAMMITTEVMSRSANASSSSFRIGGDTTYRTLRRHLHAFLSQADSID